MIIDKLSYNSKLRYENAEVKFAFAVITLLICVISRSAVTAIIVLLVTGVLTIKSGIPVFRYLKFLSMPFAFLFLSTIAIIFDFKPFYITINKNNIFYALNLILTSLSAVSCLYFLAFTTTIMDILYVLKKLKCPKIILELMLLIYRFIFILLDTAYAISIAQNARLGNINYKTSLKSFGILGSSLMLKAIKRSQNVYTAMQARCYDDTINVLSSKKTKPKVKHIIIITLFDGFLLIFSIWSKFFI